ncbi:hypothetical protein D8M41_01685 [Rothia sp. HSID18069]|uniref:Uncharacterized protein n=2 Tax=Rothia aeria TaxID=172042 RepID=U7V2U7_9MICC|nr:MULTISPECIES: hypothetical protein [Rothia]EID50073.1 hypothetical protein HMPREF1324_1526 [Rothia aeria F0474]ERT65484.1 hypothetical protein HMPREF0742_01874 [Rothia aeria F0184]QXW91707.1 hypothetical protein LPB401_06480 [Rothia aeria]RUP73126.1 hypothetical protein D8M41_01685 [Rothia sp. HSID18069]
MNILITLLALATLLIVIYSAVVISSDRAFPGRAFFEHIAGDGLNVFGARTQPAPELAGQQVVVLEPLPDNPAAADNAAAEAVPQEPETGEADAAHEAPAAAAAGTSAAEEETPEKAAAAHTDTGRTAQVPDNDVRDHKETEAPQGHPADEPLTSEDSAKDAADTGTAPDGAHPATSQQVLPWSEAGRAAHAANTAANAVVASSAKTTVETPAAAKPHEDDSAQHKNSTSGAIVAINKEIADKESAHTTDKADS